MKSISSALVGLLVLGTGLIPGVSAVPKAPWTRERAKGYLRKGPTPALERRDTTAECQIQGANIIAAPRKNIWGGLTGKEAADITAWLFAQEDLNLTISANATDWDNRIVLIELLQPNKTDALDYVDGDAPEPARYAHVVIDQGASEEPTYDDIKVGPLPISKCTTKWEPFEYQFTRKTGGRVRNLDSDAMWEFIGSIAESVEDITLDLWNASTANEQLVVWGIDPMIQEGGRIKRWDAFWGNPTSDFDVGTLLPMGLYFLSDVTGRDPEAWVVEGWYYNGIFYGSTEEFRDAYFSGSFEKLAGNFDGPWAQTDRQGPVPPMDTKAPPVAVAPGGSRFSVDPVEKYVEWMDWSFMIGFNRDTGMTLHDIRFKGQRILYELSLQEALAHYAGSDPMQAHTAYLDSYYGFGPFAFELLPGYDCPAYATMLNSSFYVSETTRTHVNSICLFEFNGDYPMSRHSTTGYVAATQNIYFVTRFVSTIGNYDYMFSYTFFMDGSMAVEVRASGYIQSAFYAHNEDYGFKIHDSLSGSMHDHVLNFKADFDILGTANTVQVQAQVPESRTFPWSQGRTLNTMTLKRSFIENEDQGRFNWSPNSANQIFVVNQDVKNKYGQFPAYRILPMTSGAHLTMDQSTHLNNAAHWAEHDIAISVRKDTEFKSAHRYNSMDTFDPPIDFNKFFDGESLSQEDLVLWFNLGMHHVPHTGDLPNTVFTYAHAGVQFVPVNYLDVGANVETVNMVRVDYSEGKTTAVETFGAAGETCGLDYEPAHADLWGYTGDVVVRKFPYEPNDPYYETSGIE